MKLKLLHLLKTHSYRTGTFILASGKTSPFFFDCKKTLLLADGNILASELILSTISSFMREFKVGIDAVAGVALGGCPLATGVSIASVTSPATQGPKLNSLYVRKETKDHGTQRLIEGSSEGKNVALLEDVITTGGSSMDALAVLKSEGYNPVVVITIIDRLQGGTDDIRKRYDIPVYSLYTIEDFK